MRCTEHRANDIQTTKFVHSSRTSTFNSSCQSALKEVGASGAEEDTFFLRSAFNYTTARIHRNSKSVYSVGSVVYCTVRNTSVQENPIDPLVESACKEELRHADRIYNPYETIIRLYVLN